MNTVAAYQAVANSVNQTELIKQYASLVKRIAHHVAGRLPNTVQIDDLIQSGMIGLLEAAKNYDSSKGASFETYAGIRVRGTMLDEVRKNDWLPRSVYRTARNISLAVRTIENRTGRDAKDIEVATELGVELDVYHNMLRDTNYGQMYGFDDLGLTEDVLEDYVNRSSFDPVESVARETFCDDLTDCIDGLPERERLVLSLYYDEELNLKEIGAILGVCESRVCQIHSQAMIRIQSRMPEWRR